MREADVSTATVVSKLANIERLAGFAMVGSDDLVNAALPPPADVPVQARNTETRAVAVRGLQAAAVPGADKSSWSSWGSGWFAGRAPA